VRGLTGSAMSMLGTVSLPGWWGVTILRAVWSTGTFSSLP